MQYTIRVNGRIVVQSDDKDDVGLALRKLPTFRRDKATVRASGVQHNGSQWYDSFVDDLHKRKSERKR